MTGHSLHGASAASASRPVVSSLSLPSVCVVGELPPPMGGMAIQAQKLSEGLRREGHQVVNVRTNPLAHDSALRRIRFLRGIVNAAWFLVNLLRAVPRVECIHVLSNSQLSFFLFTAPAIVLGRLLGKRVVVHYHGGGAEAFLARWQALALPMLRRANAIVVPSGYLAGIFRRYGLLAAELPNVLDLEGFGFRHRVPLKPLVIVARHLQPEYAVGVAIRAFAEVARDHPDARAIIAGDGKERNSLQGLCEELAIADRVRFVGNVPTREMQALYAMSHIYLNASRIDNQPVSILEAFAAGLPVVSSAAGGIPFLVADGQTGLLAADGTHQSLAAHIRTLLAQPELAQSLVLNAHASVQLHRWDAVYARLSAIYRNPGSA